MADPDPYATIQGDTIPGAPAPPAKKKATVRIGVPEKAPEKPEKLVSEEEAAQKKSPPYQPPQPAPPPVPSITLPTGGEPVGATYFLDQMVKRLEAFGYEVKKPKD